MVRPGASRKDLASTLNAAYARGLLSENTLSHRLDLLFENGLLDVSDLVGDLNWRGRRRHWQTRIRSLFATTARALTGTIEASAAEPPRLLALDWSGGQHELIAGRDPTCDLVLTPGSVSRRHARLLFRDGGWVIQDLESRNGTEVNGVAVGRCELRPGDHVILGDEHLLID